MNVEAFAVRPTNAGVAGGMDVSVTVSVNGITCDGDVTMVSDAINGGWSAYGNAADYWVSGALLSWLERLDEGSTLAEMLRAIEDAAAAACERA